MKTSIIFGLVAVLVVLGAFAGAIHYRDLSACTDPMVLEAPVDINRATSILYPGQMRGGDFKRHGGFRFDTATSNAVEVRAPIDSTLSAASRYIERGQLQYLLDFETECGVRYRFDHILAMPPALSAVLETLPAAKVDDSRTTGVSRGVRFKKGELIATEVGMPGNVFVDFGVYESGGLLQFQGPQSNPLCWLDMLPASQAVIVKGLPAGDQNSGTKSEYCR